VRPQRHWCLAARARFTWRPSHRPGVDVIRGRSRATRHRRRRSRVRGFRSHRQGHVPWRPTRSPPRRAIRVDPRSDFIGERCRRVSERRGDDLCRSERHRGLRCLEIVLTSHVKCPRPAAKSRDAESAASQSRASSLSNGPAPHAPMAPPVSSRGCEDATSASASSSGGRSGARSVLGECGEVPFSGAVPAHP